MDKVIFRRFKKGNDIIALFPEIDADPNPAHCMSYMHVGQHGAANYKYIISCSKPATKKEYCFLKVELEKRGYSLDIRRKFS